MAAPRHRCQDHYFCIFSPLGTGRFDGAFVVCRFFMVVTVLVFIPLVDAEMTVR